LATELQYYSKKDVSAYAGQWIALLDDQVIANGKKLKEVYAKANSKSKGQKPFFIRVPRSKIEQIL
jgi:Family of unknown function (DUF5678)